MSEAQLSTPQPVDVSTVMVVTNENFDAFVDKQLGVVKEPAEAAKEELAKAAPKAEAKQEPEEVEEIDHPDEKKKGKLNERFSELTKARKDAQEAAETARKEAQEARESARKASDEAQALRNKYEPPKSDELGPEPKPEQFTDINEYSKALKEWTADSVRIEDKNAEKSRKAQEQQEATVKAWKERQEKIKAEVPDYEEVVGKSDVKVSNEVRDAIIESDVGPALLLHLARNPDVADKLSQMTVGRALRELGKLEASLSGETVKEVKEAPKTTVAQMSKAPPPITPLRGANAPASNLSGADEVPKNMTYDEWKSLRQAGKIR